MSFGSAVRRGLYYVGQSARGSVTPSRVRRAIGLMEGSEEDLWLHVTDGLRSVHGAAPDPLEWLVRQPLTDRRDVAARVRTGEVPAGRLEWKRTSGSTGSPLRLPRDMTMASWIDATMWALYSWHGVRPGDRHARFWGVPLGGRSTSANRLRNGVLNRIAVDAFSMGPDQALGHFQRMRSGGIRYIHGYPSALAHFAALLSDMGHHGGDLGVRAVFSTGEFLAPVTRARIADFFDCRVVNEYGCAESGLLGFECERGEMHVVPLTAFPQVVGPDGVPVSEGEVGEVVVTDVVGHVFPLLRYRLRDRANGPSRSECPCGRPLPVCRIAEGRAGAVIRLPDGRGVYSAVIAYAMPQEVRRFQARQVRADELVVRIVSGPAGDWSEIEAAVRQGLRQRLPEAMRISIVQVDDATLPFDGKLRYFIPLESASDRGEAAAGSEVDGRA